MGVRIIWQGLPTAVIKTLPEPIMNMFETNEKIESLSTDKENIKKNQMEILELKNTITYTKKLKDGLNSRIENTE